MDGITPHLQVHNKDPNKHYVWVYLNGPGVATYESMGYDVVRFEPDGVRLFGKKVGELGQDVIRDGNVLMSCSLERKREIDLYGAYGTEDHPVGGQLDANALEERIVRQRGGMDPLRGLTGIIGRQSGAPTMAVVNETSPLELEKIGP